MSAIWLVGAGGMARDYAKVLTALGLSYDVIGRADVSATRFEEDAGVPVTRGGLEKVLASGAEPPVKAIICVGVEALAKTTAQLLLAGAKRILVEKPAGCSPSEIKEVHDLALGSEATVVVGYNRRFYESVLCAKKMIAEDGGITSFNFEFTEWAHVIDPLQKGPGVKEHWFLNNSTHVVDLAFYLAGIPKEISCYTSGKLNWHPSASAYAGAGISESGAIFSYQANWAAPGRWSVEVLTKLRRYVFRPLEKLQVQHIGSVTLEPVAIDDLLDREFKPGLFLQTRNFLEDRLEGMCTLAEHYTRLPVYCRMAGYLSP